MITKENLDHYLNCKDTLQRARLNLINAADCFGDVCFLIARKKHKANWPEFVELARLPHGVVEYIYNDWFRSESERKVYCFPEEWLYRDLSDLKVMFEKQEQDHKLFLELQDELEAREAQEAQDEADKAEYERLKAKFGE